MSLEFKIGKCFPTKCGTNIKIIEYINSHNILIEFQDKFKYRTIKQANMIRKGSIKNPFFPNIYGVGYLGLGEFKTHITTSTKVISKEYNVWRGMIRRCYDEEKLKQFPSYRDCSVHPEWHNFQNFAKWYTSHKYYDTDYELDKDLLVPNNRIYTPDTCTLIPKELNLLFLEGAQSKTGLPLGITMSSDGSNRFQVRLSMNGKRKHIGYYHCIEKAKHAYMVAKTNHVESKINEFTNSVDIEILNALKEWVRVKRL